MDANLLAALTCPLSGLILHDPVILAESGFSYDRASLVAWIAEHGTDPATRLPLQDTRLLPNPAIASMAAALFVPQGPPTAPGQP